MPPMEMLRDMPSLDFLSSNHLTVSAVLGWTLLSFLCWVLLYCGCYLAARGSQFFLQCVTCILRALHAVVVVFFTVLALEEPPHPIIECGEGNIPLHNFVLLWSMGYFALECALAILLKSEPWSMMIHHFISLTTIGATLIIQEGGAEMMAGMLLLESTNPLFQTRQLLRLTKYKDGYLYKLLEWSFILLFTFIRILPSGVIALIITFDTFCNIQIRIAYFLFYLLNIVMVYFTWRYAHKKYFKKIKSF